jgi:hypothetical protein
MSTRRVNPSTFNCIRKEMDAKYDGKCSNEVCSSPIEVGDRIMFTNFQGKAGSTGGCNGTVMVTGS